MQNFGGELGREDVDQLTNGNNLTIMFSRGSYVNAFDYESVSQRWILNPDGGAVAYMAQVRSIPEFVGHVDTLFFKYMFSGTARTVGEAAAFSDGTGFYGLLGDPELAPWTAR
jgi:hypothetical protein